MPGGPRRDDVLDHGFDVALAPDAGELGDRGVAAGDDDLLAGLDLGEQFGLRWVLASPILTVMVMEFRTSGISSGWAEEGPTERAERP